MLFSEFQFSWHASIFQIKVSNVTVFPDILSKLFYDSRAMEKNILRLLEFNVPIETIMWTALFKQAAICNKLIALVFCHI